jgi:cell division protein ZapA
MSDQGQDQQRSTTVQIFGSEYTIRSQTDPEYVHQVAEIVDEAMRNVNADGTKKSATGVAVLAAMNLANELLSARKELEELLQRIDESTDALTRVLEADGETQT